MKIAGEGPIGLAPGYRFQWEQAQQAYVLLFPEGMITLNGPAGEILRRCDGASTFKDLIDDLQRQFPRADLCQDVEEFLQEAHERGWIRIG